MKQQKPDKETSHMSALIVHLLKFVFISTIINSQHYEDLARYLMR